MLMKKEFLECGRIVGAHGVKGLMKIESWCDSPKILAAQKRVFLAEKDGYKEVSVESASVSGPLVLMGLSGYLNRELVQGMKNTVLYLKREDIPLKKGALLLADIIWQLATQQLYICKILELEIVLTLCFHCLMKKFIISLF